MAQDFFGTFGLGRNDTTISPMDMTGVSLAAVQALAKQFETKNAELEQQLEAKNAQLEQLAARLAALEAKLNP
jgi:DNA-binding transcriptional MerR regulator